MLLGYRKWGNGSQTYSVYHKVWNNLTKDYDTFSLGFVEFNDGKWVGSCNENGFDSVIFTGKSRKDVASQLYIYKVEIKGELG